MTNKRLKIDTTIKTKKYSLQFAKKIGYLKKQSFQQMHCWKSSVTVFALKYFVRMWWNSMHVKDSLQKFKRDVVLYLINKHG